MIERQPREGLPGFRSADDGCDLFRREQTGKEFGQKSDVRGVSSDGFNITRLPAASAATSGTIVRLNG